MLRRKLESSIENLSRAKEKIVQLTKVQIACGKIFHSLKNLFIKNLFIFKEISLKINRRSNNWDVRQL